MEDVSSTRAVTGSFQTTFESSRVFLLGRGVQAVETAFRLSKALGRLTVDNQFCHRELPAKRFLESTLFLYRHGIKRQREKRKEKKDSS